MIQIKGYAGAWCPFEDHGQSWRAYTVSGNGNQRVGKLVSEPLNNLKDLI